jgi:hypothetical protein
MTPKITFGAVRMEHIDLVWPDARELLSPAVATVNGKLSTDDIYQHLKSGSLVLWIAAEDMAPVAAITTRIIEYPGRRAMAMDWIGGSRMRDWLPLAHATLVAHAKQNKCEHLEGYGRKGWGRQLSSFGWKPEYIAYRMDI